MKFNEMVLLVAIVSPGVFSPLMPWMIVYAAICALLFGAYLLCKALGWAVERLEGTKTPKRLGLWYAAFLGLVFVVGLFFL